MNRLVTVTLLVFVLSGLCPANSAVVSADSINKNLKRSFHDQWFSQDKAHHFMVSAFLTGFSYYTFKQEFGHSEESTTIAAVSVSLSIGIGKEIYDGVSGKGTPSFKDIVADAAGVAVGILILNVSSP